MLPIRYFNKQGYFLYNPEKGPQKPRREALCAARQSRCKDELYDVVNYSGKVLDAVVEHDIYGQMLRVDRCSATAWM